MTLDALSVRAEIAWAPRKEPDGGVAVVAAIADAAVVDALTAAAGAAVAAPEGATAAGLGLREAGPLKEKATERKERQHKKRHNQLPNCLSLPMVFFCCCYCCFVIKFPIYI